MNCRYKNKWSYDLRSYQRNFCNCVEKPEKFRTSTGFEPVTSRFRCDALTNWAMKPLTLGAGHLWVLMVPWGMNQWWNGTWNESYMNCGYEIKWSYDLRSYERNFCNCVEKPEKFRTSTVFELVTSRFRCDALTNWAMKPLTLGAGHLWVLMVPWLRRSELHLISYPQFIYDSFHIPFHHWFIPHGTISTQVLNFSGFSTQLQKLRS